MADFISFDERTTCIACGEGGSVSLWSGRFSDAEVSSWIAKCHYTADLGTLGNQPFDLRECNACGQRYHRFVISNKEVPVIYGEWIDAEQVSRFEKEHTNKTDRFTTSVGLIKLVLRLRHMLLASRADTGPIRILDYGCGNGELLRVASFMGMTSIGIDVSASRRSAANSNDIVVCSDWDEFDARNLGPVDCVVLSEVLEHVTAPMELLKAVHERMIPSGILFVAVPNCDGITKPNNFSEFRAVQPIEHVNAFTPESLTKMVCRLGFVPQKRPVAFVTTHPFSAARTAANLFYHPADTDQFFKRA